MNELREKLFSEIEGFRETGHKFLNKELSVPEFKGISGGMGVYAERSKNTFMIRLRTPSGMIKLDEMQWMIDKAEANNLKWIHFTTREAVQFHNLSIDAVCDLMKDALENNIYTRGAGGNFPRNVALSPLSGVERGEAFDVTPYALLVNKYFIERITGYKLPRKLKVGFSNGNKDEAHCSMTDLGLLAVNDNGRNMFKVYIGGGLGQNPKIGVALDELVDPSEVLYHVEAITRLFIAEGDYNNKAKARIRYILERMGEEEFKNCYKKHLAEVKKELDLTVFIEPQEYTKAGIKTDIVNNKLVEQKQEGLYSVYFHPIGGQAAIKDLNDIISLIKNMEDIELRLTMTEGIYIRNLNGKEAEALLELIENRGGETKLQQSVSCIGVPICQMGLGESQTMLDEILAYFKEKNYTKDILPSIHISGCVNSCAFHQGALIGFTGKRKKFNDVMEPAFELYINGSFEQKDIKLAKTYGVLLAREIPEFLYKLSLQIEDKNVDFIEYVEKYENEIIELVEQFN